MAQDYHPPTASVPVLGKITDLVANAKPIDRTQFGKHGATFIGTLPGGELYFEVPTMDVDDDGDASGSPLNWVGHPVRGGKIDRARQEQTSYGGQLARRPGHTDGISPFEVPYIVLPGGKTGASWFAQHGIKVGDGAMVIRGGTLVEAVFADAGPMEKIGEMSIKCHQLFGETVVVDGKQARLGSDGKPLLDPVTGKILTVISGDVGKAKLHKCRHLAETGDLSAIPGAREVDRTHISSSTNGLVWGTRTCRRPGLYWQFDLARDTKSPVDGVENNWGRHILRRKPLIGIGSTLNLRVGAGLPGDGSHLAHSERCLTLVRCLIGANE
ncbi:MAG: hypothetical protein M3O31_00840 [Acidobacteriota bacterium]|nr:hypothetical protein [Acidobacteriota bacterium]